MSDLSAPASKGHLLIVDDDMVLADRMGKAMERRGFRVTVFYAVADALEWVDDHAPDYALVDLRLADGSGLDITQKIKDTVPDCRVVMMTAYGNIATAVAAVKAGAVDYLTKPADADAVEAALLADGSGGAALPPPPSRPMSAERVRWEHIQRIYEQCERNVSETARRLGMHRRTLQRILAKYAPRENADS
ncbi:MAG: ActR/PrrA/RegA family redox response regulator transcription factor [Rhodospirillales bacterium]|nr:ActR/PrrA/RegA family redox response regulator transcription factor [Alphaproteobacteria bacterium]MCB9987498.1 ActR/PrrA/RegA family redox response regulator transcription factor [Rhodospirillales bacterium]USO07528.1 MAG: ActR/PrrA/RegA family redox response regulator transcription factor [Rhodospirillales bacterium]